jgi:hypothetical protein
MWFYSERKRYVRAMLKAINKAREPIWIDEKWQSKTDGLRVIKRFERVNKTKFDPHSKRHLEMIHGNASHEHFFRKAGYIFSRHLNT